jgi:hypothetical protein
MEQLFQYENRFNVVLNRTLIYCQEKDCSLEISPEWEANDGPLVSSNPNCPIIDIKFMHDDGNGIPTHAASPDMFRFERNGTKIRSVQNNSAIAEKLRSGEKLNFVMIAETAGGLYEKPGQMMTFEFTLPGCSGNETLIVEESLKDMGMTPAARW